MESRAENHDPRPGTVTLAATQPPKLPLRMHMPIYDAEAAAHLERRVLPRSVSASTSCCRIKITRRQTRVVMSVLWLLAGIHVAALIAPAVGLMMAWPASEWLASGASAGDPAVWVPVQQPHWTGLVCSAP
jgi:hypothetical protein